MRKISFIFCLFLLIAPINKTFAEGADNEKVTQFVQAVSDDVIKILNAGGSSEAIKENLTNKFKNTVDINWIAKFVVGKHWKDFSDTEQQSYLESYKKFIIASYVPVFKSYNGQKLKILGVKYIGSGYYIVKTSIVKENSTVEYIVEYRIKDLKGTYMVRDIIAEGVSLISTQRSEFGSLISAQGLNTLNNQLLEKANNLNN